MTYIRIQGNVHENAAGTAPFCTLGAAVGSGHAVFVTVAWNSALGDTVTGITDDKSNVYTLVDLLRNPNAGGGGVSLQTAYCLNVTNAPITITATLSATSGFAADVIVDEYDGVQQSGVIDGHAINSQDSPGTTADLVTSTAIVPVANGDLIYGVGVDGGGNGIVSGTGFTSRQSNLAGAISSCTEDLTQTTAASIAATFTDSTAGAHCLSAVMAFKSGPNSFGALLGTLSVGKTSITNPTAAVGSVVVSVGDLVVGAFAERIASANPTSTTVTDNLGNTYTAKSAGSFSGNVGLRMYWSRVTVAGTLTSVSAVATASTDDAAFFVAAFAGAFAASPLDASPTDTTDTATPFTCPATGTLAQAIELVVCAIGCTVARTMAATAPLLLAGEADSTAVGTTASCTAAIGYKVVASTVTTTDAFTGTNPTTAVEALMSFKQAVAVYLPYNPWSQAAPILAQ